MQEFGVGSASVSFSVLSSCRDHSSSRSSRASVTPRPPNAVEPILRKIHASDASDGWRAGGGPGWARLSRSPEVPVTALTRTTRPR